MTFKRPTSAGLIALAAGLLAATAACAEPTVNKGDNAWMLTSTVLVLLMTIPGLALFYGGLVRSKNMLSVLMQVFYCGLHRRRALCAVRLQPRLHRRLGLHRRLLEGLHGRRDHRFEGGDLHASTPTFRSSSTSASR